MRWSGNQWPTSSRTCVTTSIGRPTVSKAWRSCADHPDISVIVTDIAMPRLDGVTFASQARLLHPDLKVLFLSGLQRPPASEEFLAKPFPVRALVSAVQHLLDARTSQSEKAASP